MRSVQFCAMPTPAPEVSEWSLVVADALEWLVSRQNGDGSWGAGSGLDKLICTTHVVMTLICAGYSPVELPLRPAIRWLMSIRLSEHNNSYWVLGPLAALPTARESVAERELKHLEEVLTRGAKPYPHQLVEAYYLRALAVTGVQRDERAARACLDFIRTNFETEKCWFDRPDSTTDGYAALYEFDPSKAAELKADVVRFLDRKAMREGDKLNWGSEISTSYTIMNAVASDLSDDPAVREELNQAARGLIAKRKDGGWWVSDPPFGGKQDIKSPDFATAVVTRAIIAILAMNGRAVHTELMSIRKRRAADVAEKRGRRALYLAALLLLAAFTPADEWLLGLVPSTGNIDWPATFGVIATVLSLAIGIIALPISIYPDDVKLQVSAWQRRLRLPRRLPF